MFRDTEFVFGRKVPFKEAFPEIKEARVEVQTMTNIGSRFIVPDRPNISVYEAPDIGEYIDCENPDCYNGGFSIGSILHDMVQNKQTEYEGTATCKGYEGSPKGRKRYGSCVNWWKIKVKLQYQ